MKRSKGAAEEPVWQDKHALYEAAVQNVDESIATITRIYRRRNGRAPRLLREDFCGTAALACEWVLRHKENRSLGVDLDAATLAWAHRHNVLPLREKAGRVELRRANVLDVKQPKADAIAAFNFSYFVFKERDALREYFCRARRALAPGGMLICDLFGGTEAMASNLETRDIDACSTRDGRQLPRFRYYWEHEHFNVVTHEILCHIHFRVAGRRKMREVFTYDWRLWTLPEVQEIMREVGFVDVGVYIHGWLKDGEPDGIFRLRERFENEVGWLAYVAGFRAP